MKFALFLLSLSFCQAIAAQQTYIELRSQLAEMSCTKKPSMDECRQSIAIIENWMHANPTGIGASTFDDLQMYYYHLSAKDTVNTRIYLEQSARYNIKYSEFSEPKEKHWGYWNAAVCYTLLNDCENAIKYLQLSRKSPGAKKRYRDKGTEKGIKRKCRQS